MNIIKEQIPSCGIIYYPYTGDYDCEYAYSGQIECDKCICNYNKTGGVIDPRTGKKFKGRLLNEL